MNVLGSEVSLLLAGDVSVSLLPISGLSRDLVCSLVKRISYNVKKE